jgi:hypothetical protein
VVVRERAAVWRPQRQRAGQKEARLRSLALGAGALKTTGTVSITPAYYRVMIDRLQLKPLTWRVGRPLVTIPTAKQAQLGQVRLFWYRKTAVDGATAGTVR